MKDVLSMQFEQFWRIFKCIVSDFNDEKWTSIGHELTMPMKLAYHIVHSIKFYINDKQDCVLSNGRKFQFSIDRVNENNFFERNEIIELISKTSLDVDNWIKAMDLDADNKDYPWTGNNMLSVVLFVIRHSYYHLGELSTLLNEYLEGKAKDNFANNIN